MRVVWRGPSSALLVLRQVLYETDVSDECDGGSADAQLRSSRAAALHTRDLVDRDLVVALLVGGRVQRRAEPGRSKREKE